MKWVFLYLFAILMISNSSAMETFEIESRIINDKYDIIVRLPANMEDGKSYPLILYLDAGLNAGKTIPNSFSSKVKEKHILVGIKHQGSYKKKRRRDFLPPHIQRGKSFYSNDPNYGQANNFHQFLKHELLPEIEKKYPIQNNNKTIVGHSFGGLFAIFALMQEQPIFDSFIAISPSLWVNNSVMLRVETYFHEKHDSLSGKLFISAGSLEIFNRILGNVKAFSNRLKKRGYEELKLWQKIYSMKSHNNYTHLAIQDAESFLFKEE